MEDIKILIPTTNNLNILFINPSIESQTMLKFKKNTCSTESYYDLTTKKILMKMGNSAEANTDYIHLKLSNETIEILETIHKNEYSKINLFFNSLNIGTCKLLINEDKTIIDTKELIDNCYNPYYCKLFTYFINSKFKQNFKNIEDIQSFLLNKVDCSKYSLENIEDYGNFYIVPIKDIK